MHKLTRTLHIPQIQDMSAMPQQGDVCVHVPSVPDGVVGRDAGGRHHAAVAPRRRPAAAAPAPRPAQRPRGQGQGRCG